MPEVLEEQGRYRDFDAAFAESKAEPLTLKIFGEVEQLPAHLPAGVVLEIMRIQAERGDNFQDADFLFVAVRLFGTEKIDRWADKGLDIVQLAEIVGWALKEYGVTPKASAGASGSKSRKKSAS